MKRRMICTNCQYSFVPRIESKIPERCPYCDKEGTLHPVKSMQEWIDEVSKEME